MPALVDPASGRRYPIGERLSIGRAASSDLAIDDPLVSAAHAEVVHRGGHYVIRDLGSRRGTFVGDARVDEALLEPGVELLIGPTRLRFELGPEPDERGAADRDELHRLRAVVALGQAIGAEHDLDRLLDRVLATCFELLRADRGAIIVYPSGSLTPCATVARTRAGEPVTDALSTSVLSEMMSSPAPYLRTERDGASHLPRSASLSAQGVRSLMAVPLIYDVGEREWLGVIQLDSQASQRVFTPGDLELLVAIAGQAALAIKNVMLVRRVHAVQRAEWRRLERVVDDLPVGVIVLDDERRCVLANPWVSARAATIGDVAAGQVVARVAGIACEQLVGVDVRRQVTIGNPERAYTVAAHTAGDSGDTVVVMTDVTEVHEQQSRVAHRDRLALVGQLAGGIAHDFNNLLCVVLNNALLLEEWAATPDAAEAATVITQASRQAAQLVAQLLAFSRREVVRPRVVDVGALVATMTPVLERTLGARHQLTVSTPEAMAKVLIDPSQLEQVVMNLVVNARDALGARGHVAITVSTAVIAGASRVLLDVADDGIGMPPEVIARVFEPYFSTKAPGKGSGLGLATVHGIIQQAAGEITIESTPGRGTRFRVALPATELAIEAPADTTAPTSRGRILLVDDDDSVRRMTERMLVRAGFAVVAAASGQAALAAAQDGGRFDLLLTDMVMPGMSGRELAHDLLAEDPSLRVLFMSGYHHGTPVPGWQLVAKPFDRAVLMAAIESALVPRGVARSAVGSSRC